MRDDLLVDGELIFALSNQNGYRIGVVVPISLLMRFREGVGTSKDIPVALTRWTVFCRHVEVFFETKMFYWCDTQVKMEKGIQLPFAEKENDKAEVSHDSAMTTE